MSAQYDFSMPPVRMRESFTATVVSREQISPVLVRLQFQCPNWVGFDFPSATDTYIKAFFPAADGSHVMRSYTVRHADVVRGHVDIDFVVHGDEGVAGRWARDARVGDTLDFGGIGGGYIPHQEAAHHLLIGDESALPAIAVALEAMPVGASIRAFIEIEAPGHEVPLSHSDAVTWVYRNGARAGEALVQAVGAAGEIAVDTHVFLHGEAMSVRDIRRSLRAMGMSPRSMSVSGYWRAGVNDEQWRDSKREWNQSVAADDESLNVG
ncbi:siderophore-interacting protein [Jonesia quinghaiensis]|uniref:siderophore-interacting protein n=1 Tax=Jonesia quinghaiensis TaxID=262806 RepID=UPI00040474AD|nr:siderophore-interacting protein [Jonesia quinghaiensis]